MVLAAWQSLILQYNVQGKRAHDVRLVAAMQRHGVTNLLTFNSVDFSHFPISVFTPADVLLGKLPAS